MGNKYLAGIISWGPECGSPIQPGLYTNVFKILDWIKNKTTTANNNEDDGEEDEDEDDEGEEKDEEEDEDEDG